jgi:hypothetical protein
MEVLATHDYSGEQYNHMRRRLKSQTEILQDKLVKAAESLLSDPERYPENFSLVLCMTCPQSWLLHESEDAQFTHAHRCREPRPRKVLRMSWQTIWPRKAQRDESALKRRRELSGRR